MVGKQSNAPLSRYGNESQHEEYPACGWRTLSICDVFTVIEFIEYPHFDQHLFVTVTIGNNDQANQTDNHGLIRKVSSKNGNAINHYFYHGLFSRLI
jgi:hypothetical protein